MQSSGHTYPIKSKVGILKGTDNVAEYLRLGALGLYEGNTDIDHRLDQEKFSIHGLFVNPRAFKHLGTLLDQAEGVLFNCITDPDINPQCLANLNMALKQKPRNIINHPRQVLQTRRHNVAARLQGIDGLIVPKAIRVDGNRLSELRASIEHARLRYPLLVRSIAAHNQQHLLKIDSPSQLSTAEKLPGKGWYATEFYDCRSPDGLYRNYRFFVFATGTVVARNVDIGQDWKVGVHVRKTFMQHHDALLREVADYVDDFEHQVGEHRLALLRQIPHQLGLDYVGLDCNLLPSGELLLFEANVAMNAVASRWPNGKFAWFDTTGSRLTEAFTELVQAKSSNSPQSL